MANLERLPNFFIIGAAKAGTTTLYDTLSQHPQVFFPVSKEPMFFNHDGNYSRGLAWYSSTFFQNSSSSPIRGEATPHYLYWAEKTAARIKDAYNAKGVKFIVILREPASRAYSWYWNMIREGQESLSFKEALDLERERLQKNWLDLQTNGSMKFGYFRGGCYAGQIQTYLEFFPKKDFLFILQEDFALSFAATIHQLLEFLELDESVEMEPRISNLAALPRSRNLHRILRDPSWLKKIFKGIVPLKIRHRVKSTIINANMKRAVYPAMDKETERLLRQRYVDEIKKVSTLIERDLSHWLA